MSERGAKAQEYFVCFKLLQRIYGSKFPQSAADAFNQSFLKAVQYGQTLIGAEKHNLIFDEEE